jgi:hypothetical protein
MNSLPHGDKEEVKNSIKWEKENNKKGSFYFPLYRGSPSFAGKGLFKELRAITFTPNANGLHHSNYSYGSSLLGNARDPGSCALHYMSEREPYEGYLVPINKKEYTDEMLTDKKKVHVPPIITIAALTNGNFSIHSRNIMPCQTTDVQKTMLTLKNTSIYPKQGAGYDISPLVSFFKTPEECSQSLSQFTAYVRKNLVPLNQGTAESLSRELGRPLQTPLQMQQNQPSL